MVDLLLVRIRFGIGLADTLGDDTRVALGVAGIFAVFALHSGGILEEIAAQSTSHDVVELLRYELMAVHLVDLFLPLSDGTFSVESNIERPPVLGLFCKADGQVDCTRRLECEPCINRWGGHDGIIAVWASSSSTSAASALRRGTKLWLLCRIHVELWRWRAPSYSHSISRNPSGVVNLSLNPLPPHFFHDIRYPDP